MTETLPCLPITQSVVQQTSISRLQWERTLLQASSQCMRERRCGECQIKKCLDVCLLGMLYPGKEEARKAIKYIYPLYFKDLLYYVQGQGCEQIQEAEDIVQSVLIDFFVRAQKVKLTLHEASLKTYLYRAVRNRWIDRTRTSIFRDTTFEDISTEESDSEVGSIEQELEKQKKIYVLLQKIFPRTHDNCGQIMRYYFFKLMSYEEIMGTDVGKMYSSIEALRNKVHSCSEKFKRVIADEALLREFAEIYGIDIVKVRNSGSHHAKV